MSEDQHSGQDDTTHVIAGDGYLGGAAHYESTARSQYAIVPPPPTHYDQIPYKQTTSADQQRALSVPAARPPFIVLSMVISLIVLIVVVLGGTIGGIWYFSIQSLDVRAKNLDATATALQQGQMESTPPAMITQGVQNPYGTGALIYSDSLNAAGTHNWGGKHCTKTADALVVMDYANDDDYGASCDVPEIEELAEFTIEVTSVMTAAGSDDATKGIGFRLTSTTAFFFYLNHTGAMYLISSKDGMGTTIWSGQLASTEKTGLYEQHVLAVSCDGQSIRLYVNHTLRTSYTIAATAGSFSLFATSGSAGNGEQTAVLFTDLHIWKD